MSIILILIILSITVWIKFNSRDIAAPDISNLSIQQVQIPDQENAYTYFHEAVDSLCWPQDDSLLSSILYKQTWDEDFVNELLSKNQKTLDLIEKGLDCSVFEGPGDFMSDENRPLFEIINISKLMAVRSVYELNKGKQQNAFQSCLNLFRLGSMLMAGNGGIMNFKLGLNSIDMACEQYRNLFAETALSEQMLLNLSEYLNTISIDEGMTTALKYDYQFWSDTINKVASGDLTDISETKPSSGTYSFHPNRTRTILADYYRDVIENIPLAYAELKLPDKMDISNHASNRFLLKARPNIIGRLILSLPQEPKKINDLFEIKCRIQSNLSALQIIAACHLYELKYGRTPDTLSALVPNFLEEIPRDPFDGKPFRYLQKEAIIYSVGTDLIDTTGPTELPETQFPVPLQTDDLIYTIHLLTE